MKPRDERSDDASAIIRRLQPALANVDGITLYMQPVQDLTVEDRVSRTQFQYSIEDADAQELAQWTPKLVDKLRQSPVLRDVATDQLNGGLRTTLTIDRDTASRLGILPQAIDNTPVKVGGTIPLGSGYCPGAILIQRGFELSGDGRSFARLNVATRHQVNQLAITKNSDRW